MEGGGTWSATETRRRVALQAEQVDVADFQHVRVWPAVNHVAGSAPVDLDRRMLVHKRPLLIRVALEADGVLRGRGAHLLWARRAVNVVAIAALHETFVHPVMEGHRKFRLFRQVAAVAKLRLGLREHEFLSFRMMRRVAGDAAHAVLRMERIQRVHVLRAAGVAREAAIGDFLRRSLLEKE